MEKQEQSLLEAVEDLCNCYTPMYNGLAVSFTKEFFDKKMKAIMTELLEFAKYKAIEEELGISLVTFFRALKEGAFVKLKDGRVINTFDTIVEDEPDYITFTIDGKYINSIADFDSYSVATKDYGKTWALTKEELL